MKINALAWIHTGGQKTSIGTGAAIFVTKIFDTELDAFYIICLFRHSQLENSQLLRTVCRFSCRFSMAPTTKRLCYSIVLCTTLVVNFLFNESQIVFKIIFEIC